MKLLKTISFLIIFSLISCQSMKPKNILVYDDEPNYCEHEKQEDCIRYENY
jgi:hypothetical protein